MKPTRSSSETSRQLKKVSQGIVTNSYCLVPALTGLEQRQNKRPILSDIRESGSIEQDGYRSLPLYRHDYHRHDEPGDEPL